MKPAGLEPYTTSLPSGEAESPRAAGAPGVPGIMSGGKLFSETGGPGCSAAERLSERNTGMSLGFHSLGVLAAPGRAVCVNSGRPKPTGKESGGNGVSCLISFAVYLVLYLDCFTRLLLVEQKGTRLR